MNSSSKRTNIIILLIISLIILGVFFSYFSYKSVAEYQMSSYIKSYEKLLDADSQVSYINNNNVALNPSQSLFSLPDEEFETALDAVENINWSNTVSVKNTLNNYYTIGRKSLNKLSILNETYHTTVKNVSTTLDTFLFSLSEIEKILQFNRELSNYLSIINSYRYNSNYNISENTLSDLKDAVIHVIYMSERVDDAEYLINNLDSMLPKGSFNTQNIKKLVISIMHDLSSNKLDIQKYNDSIAYVTMWKEYTSRYNLALKSLKKEDYASSLNYLLSSLVRYFAFEKASSIPSPLSRKFYIVEENATLANIVSMKYLLIDNIKDYYNKISFYKNALNSTLLSYYPVFIVKPYLYGYEEEIKDNLKIMNSILSTNNWGYWPLLQANIKRLNAYIYISYKIGIIYIESSVVALNYLNKKISSI